MTSPAPTPDAPRHSLKRRVLRWALGAALLLLVLVALAWGALHGYILPRIVNERAAWQTQLSQTMGQRLQVGAVRQQGSWWQPELVFEEVRLFDAQAREVLRLPQVRAALNPLAALQGQLAFLALDQPELHTRRDAQGRVWVAGMDTSQPSDGRAADWFFSQADFALTQGVLHWHDETLPAAKPAPKSAAAPAVLTLRDLSVHLRKAWFQHDWQLAATPPAPLGQTLSVRAQGWQAPWQRAGDWAQWSGQMTAELSHLDWAAWRTWVPLDPNFALQDARGDMRLQLAVQQGQPVSAEAELNMAALDVRLGAGLAPLRLRQIKGQLDAQWSALGLDLHTPNLNFDTAEGEHWPGGALQLNWRKAVNADANAGAGAGAGAGANAGSGSLRADRLDLGALAQVSQRLPLPKVWREALTRVRPQGHVSQLKAAWQSTPEGLHYNAQGQVKRLALQRDTQAGSPLAQLPGVQGAHIDFDLTHLAGQAVLRFDKGSLSLPDGLDDTVAIDEAMAQLSWTQRGDALAVQLKQGRVRNADLEGEFSGSWHTDPASAPGALDLTGQLSRANAAQVHRYLPNSLPADVRRYVRDAAQAGELSQVSLRLRGRLSDMPFADPQLGEFRVSAHVARGQYAYVPPPAAAPALSTNTWPALTQLQGELVFDRAGLHFEGRTQLVGAPQLHWSKVQADIPNLAQPVLSVSGEAQGPAQQLLDVVAQSALNELTGTVLSQAQASGDVGFKLALTVPLDQVERTQVQGRLALADNTVQLMPHTPALKRARGVVQFSEASLELQNLQAEVLGGRATLGGRLVLGGAAPQALQVPSSASAASARLPAAGAASPISPGGLWLRGELTAEGLQEAQELDPALNRLAQKFSGKTSYSASLGLRRGQPEVLLSSDLRGFGLALPAPLNKPADTALPLRLSLQLTPESLLPKARVLHDQLHLSLDRLVSIHYVRDLSGPQARVLRGNWVVGASAGTTANAAAALAASRETVLALAPSVSLTLQLPTLDVDAWRDVITELSRAELASNTAVAAPPTPASADYLPTVVVLQAQALKVVDRWLHQVDISGTRRGARWVLNTSAEEFKGSLEVLPPEGEVPAQLRVRLAYLNIPASEVPDVERLLTDQPSSIPALDIVVESLTLRDKKLGRLEIQAINREGRVQVANPGAAHAANQDVKAYAEVNANAGAASNATNASREWQLNTFNLILPEATLNATGRWLAEPNQARQTQLDFVLTLRDSGDLLTRFGTPGAIRGGEGKLSGQVRWQGSPVTLDIASMTGQLNLAIEKGQFLKTEPGAARLLGVLNLQALPRRLTLDFSDLFSEGFAFDSVRGDVQISQGLANTQNLQMKGVVAHANLVGEANLLRETQNLQVRVVPQINTGTASLYVATVNPLLGLGSYIAQWLLSKPLVRASTLEFRIDGTWADPRVTKVE